jgi:hypothetical protein
LPPRKSTGTVEGGVRWAVNEHPGYTFTMHSACIICL